MNHEVRLIRVTDEDGPHLIDVTYPRDRDRNVPGEFHPGRRLEQLHHQGGPIPNHVAQRVIFDGGHEMDANGARVTAVQENRYMV